MPDIKNFKNPDFAPYIESDFKGVWIEMKAIEIEYFTSFADTEVGGLKIKSNSNLDYTWSFLAPQQIMETINNTWEPWETIATRLAGKLQEFRQLVTTGVGAGKALGKGFNKMSLSNAWNELTSISKNAAKVDTPLVYTDTDRREFTLEFNLIADREGNAYDMLRAVRIMEIVALPRKDDNQLGGIKLPAVFSVKSKPDDLIIDLPFAALTSIQPTYMAPYDDVGQPMRIQLTLTFKEIQPLYATSDSMWNYPSKYMDGI